MAAAHRFVWDLHYPPPEGAKRSYPIAAIYRNTPSVPQGPAVLPGKYTVRLTVGGRSYTQPLVVKMDPRVQTPPEGLAQQFTLSMQCYEGMRRVHQTLEQLHKLRARLQELRQRAGKGSLAEAVTALDQKAAALEGSGPARRRRRGQGAGEPSLTRLQGELSTLLDVLQGADATPTTQAVAAAGEVQRALTGLLERWEALQRKDVKELDEQLRKAKLRPVVMVTP